MSPWILLRGLTREARHWGDFPKILHSADGSAPPLLPDLPGNGRRWLDASPARIPELMEAVRAQVLAQGHRPPFRLLALSLGGMAALAWATRHPEECEALVLVSTSLRPHSPLHHRLAPAAWPVLAKLLTASVAEREAAVLRLTSNRAEELAGVLPEWIAWASECPVSRANALRQLLAAARFSLRDKPPVPLLLLAGAGDRMVNPRCSLALGQHWNVECRLHPTAGHDLPLDAAEWVAEQALSR